MDRRAVLSTAAAAAGLALGAPVTAGIAGTPRRRATELRITRVLLQPARGRRSTPVAPNAYASYSGYEATEPVLRIQTTQGPQGIGCYWGPPEALRPLLGLNPFELFEWDGDTVRGVVERHAVLLDRLAGADVALFDLLARVCGLWATT
jgi:hypothetical protein